MLEVEVNPLYDIPLNGPMGQKEQATAVSRAAQQTYSAVQQLFGKKRTIHSTLVPVQVHANYNYWGGSFVYYIEWIKHVIQRCLAYYRTLSDTAAKRLTKIHSTYSAVPAIVYEGASIASQQTYSTIKGCIDSLNRREGNFLLQSKNLLAIESVLGIDGAIAICREAIEKEPQSLERTERGYAILQYLLEVKYGEGYCPIPENARLTEPQFTQFLRSLAHRAFREAIPLDSPLFYLIANDVGTEYQRQLQEYNGGRDPECIAEHLLSLGYPRLVVPLAFVTYIQHSWEKSEQILSWEAFNTIATIYDVLMAAETGDTRESNNEMLVWLECTKSLTTPFLLFSKYMKAISREIANFPLIKTEDARNLAQVIAFEINAEWKALPNEKMIMGYLLVQKTGEPQLEKIVQVHREAMKNQLFKTIIQQLSASKQCIRVANALKDYLGGVENKDVLNVFEENHERTEFKCFSRMYDRIGIVQE